MSAPIPFPPAAEVRTEVRIPLRFSDGFEADARVSTFRHLSDGAGAPAAALRRTGRGGGPARPSAQRVPHGDVFGSQRCDCGPQLREAVERLSLEGGALLYLRQEGRGIGLYAKLDAYALQDQGLDTYEARMRRSATARTSADYTAAAQMLQAVGIQSRPPLTNNPDKVAQLEALGVESRRPCPTGVHLTAANARYLQAKRDHTGHS